MTRIKPSIFPKLWNHLDRYLFAEVHPPFLMAMLIYNGIFFIKTFTQIAGIAGEVELPFTLFMFLFLSYIPKILFITLPISFLFASQAAFARLSSDSEIIAPLSTGVSFWRMNRSIVAYGLFLSFFSCILANWLEPNMAKLADSKYQSFLNSNALPNLTPGVITTLGKSDIIYVDRIVDQTLFDLWHISHREDGETVTFAKQAELVNASQKGWSLELSQANIKSFSKSGDRATETAYYQRLRREFPQSAHKRTTLAEYPESKLDTWELWEAYKKSGTVYSPYYIEIVRRFWISLTCLIFSLFATPLAAKHSRLGGGSSFGISLLFIAIFMFLFKTGVDQAGAGHIHPILALSVAPVLFLTLAIILQIGKQRGWGRITQKWKDKWLCFLDRMKGRLLRLPKKLVRRKAPARQGRRASYTYRFPTKIDIYVIRFFFQMWLLVQSSVLLLILMIEYSQISSFAKRNQIEGVVLFKYMAFRIPEVIDTTMFFCLLITVLLVFAIMSKNQEVTAIRAGGGSLQRLCLPLVILGMLASVNSYYLENLVLPWSNRNAFSLRHIIKHKEPALFTRDVWLKTNKGQLLNFKFFDRNTRTIHDATFYTLDPQHLGLKSRSIYHQIKFDHREGWVNQDDAPAWSFTFQDNQEFMDQSVIPKGTVLDVGLSLTDLDQKKRDPGEFSISQLQDYYHYLRDLGYNGNLFYTEMLAKMAQPFLPLIMMLLAMPMGFQFGRRGSFYGLGLGILMGLSFWVFFVLFKEMGASGIIPAPVAAWGVIVVFSVTAIWRFQRMGMK